MSNTQVPLGPQAYIEGLLDAGQQVVQQVGEALSTGAKAQQRAAMWPFDMAHQATAMVDAQRRYLENLGQAWQAALFPGIAPAAAEARREDSRFRDPAWKQAPFYDALKQSYLAGAKLLHDVVEQAQVDERTKLKLRFYARQYTDAISPANFPATNPEMIRTAIETQGQSLAAGMKNLLEDVQKGRITITDEQAFEVGGNLAITPGSVIYENELIQLIHYAATTEKVEKTPLLIVPPCINKFYVLDLQPANSFVRFAVEQGHNVFLISWRSANPSTAHLTWDDYLKHGIFTAMDVVAEVTRAKRLHTLGFCVGGTLLGSAAAVLAGRNDKRIATMTLLTTMLDFSDTGDIGVMVDEPYVVSREATIGSGGILPGKELAFVFSTLRANDLIWSYVVKNYLKGATPDAFDLLYWNADGVNLPGPMYCWYTRNTYLENNLKIPGKTLQCGVPVDLAKVEAPLYMLASREDHIVPWRTAYSSSFYVGGETRFVLGASGHIAGVINPPSRNKRNFWINEDRPEDAGEWLKTAKEVPGSWWPDWATWMRAFSSGTKAAPKAVGNARYKPLELAPGRYVKERAE